MAGGRLPPPPRDPLLPPPDGLGEGGGPGKPLVLTGGTGVELIIGRGRVQGPLLGFRKFTSSDLQYPPSHGKDSPERTPRTSRA